ncbi:MAG: hypothetical protein J6Y53_00605 [Alphaproteobacteria bacterium]|nr:hypothetical protein [Alphaproteobacteria bacterium]
MNEIEEKSLLKEWFAKIAAAEKEYDSYYQLVDETRKVYKDERKCDGGKYNIFWSTIETLKPFLYFKQPQFYVERQNKSANRAERAACTILEKALEWDLAQFDFDSVIKYARNDFLISGTGVLWEQYKPEFTEVPNPINPLEKLTVKKDEKVESIYVDPKDFIADCMKKGVWEEVDWVARKIYMTADEVKQNFGADDIKIKGDILVYELWDKKSRRVYWLSKACPDRFLKISSNVCGMQNFFPCPKPIWATQTNDSLIPAPDYCLIKEMLNELNGINNRMKLTMQALKVSGAYDNSFPELADILSKDVTLVSVSDFAKLRESGGIRGIIDFVPLEQYIAALEQLSKRRQDVINNIFEITGVSDIMRGNSNSADTATAIIKKTNFGTLRNQDRQNDMQRFIRDLLRIKAEIICEYFSEDKLVSFLPEEQKQENGLAEAAVSLLKTEKLRGMLFTVETGSVINKAEENASMIMAVSNLGKTVQEALLSVSTQPKLLPLYRCMVEAIISTMPRARSFDTVLEGVFNSIERELSLADNMPQVSDNQSILPEQKKKDDDKSPNIKQIIELQKNALKNKELDIKANIEAEKLAFANKELAVQTAQKQQENSKEKAD